MPALDYEDLGGISSVSTNPKAPGSSRSRDRNNKQRISFEADPARPFTGIIHLQASVSNPGNPGEMTWFDIAEMVINAEGGTWSFEPEGEFASFRVVCRDGNYWSAIQGNAAALTVAATGDFTINGITVSVNIGDDAATVAATINGTPGISGINVVADTVDTTILRIYKTDGDDLVLADTTNTPLADMGIASGTYQGGVISKIRMMR